MSDFSPPPIKPEAPVLLGVDDQGRPVCLRCGGSACIMYASIDGPNRHGCSWCEDDRTIALRKELETAKALADHLRQQVTQLTAQARRF